MALIQRGSFDSFSATVATSVLATRSSLGDLQTFSAMAEATRAVQPIPIMFGVSEEPRGFALRSLKLMKGFEGFLQNLLNPTNEVYFFAWSWDLSGAPVVSYPSSSTLAETCIIPLKSGNVREFGGAGIGLFPARKITAGLGIRIMLWESDKGARDFGTTMGEVAKKVKDSKLSELLSLISLAAGPTSTTITLVKDAMIELTDLVGIILKTNSNDYVDFYEGYYPSSEPWTAGIESHNANASEIVLTRLT